MSLATGIDLIEISRITNAIERHGDHFLRRIFTSQELAYCAGHAGRLAGRFAIKEAVGKALGTGIGDMDWTDIEALNDGRGKPILTLHNTARQLADDQGLRQWAISISHTKTHAIGFVVASGM